MSAFYSFYSIFFLSGVDILTLYVREPFHFLKFLLEILLSVPVPLTKVQYVSKDLKLHLKIKVNTMQSLTIYCTNVGIY